MFRMKIFIERGANPVLCPENMTPIFRMCAASVGLVRWSCMDDLNEEKHGNGGRTKGEID